MIWLFLAITIVLFGLLCVSLFYLIRFARIILILEDDFSDAIEAFVNTEEQLSKISEMKLFFDSKDIQAVVHQVMNDVRENKTIINRMAMRFVERSKQKYVTVIEEEPTIQELQERILREQLRGRADSTSEEKW